MRAPFHAGDSHLLAITDGARRVVATHLDKGAAGAEGGLVGNAACCLLVGTTRQKLCSPPHGGQEGVERARSGPRQGCPARGPQWLHGRSARRDWSLWRRQSS